MSNQEVKYGKNEGSSGMAIDSYELEKKSIFDKVIKPIGFLLFLFFCSAGLLSIITGYSFILDVHELSSTYDKHIFEGKYAVMLGFHYLGLSVFFLIKTLLRDDLNDKQKKFKRAGIVLSLGFSLIMFFFVGIQVSILFAITKPIIVSLFALILYWMYKGLTKYI